jgi:DNA helicase-2/ATP-dependent DNA helicase PcrA
LKRALVRHNNELNADSKRRRDPAELEAALKTVGISYSDRGAEFLEGRLFHDDLLNVMRILFEDNPLIAKITAARYPYIFVDEYQDTSKAVIDILINRILAANEHKAVLGFFGDKLQSIVFLR